MYVDPTHVGDSLQVVGRTVVSCVVKDIRLIEAKGGVHDFCVPLQGNHPLFSHGPCFSGCARMDEYSFGNADLICGRGPSHVPLQDTVQLELSNVRLLIQRKNFTHHRYRGHVEQVLHGVHSPLGPRHQAAARGRTGEDGNHGDGDDEHRNKMAFGLCDTWRHLGEVWVCLQTGLAGSIECNINIRFVT